METRELKLFITVAEELNFRAAAEKLNLSQPPLTRAISKLEDDLGVKLFIRSTRKVELTPAGMSLLRDAKEVLQKIEEAKTAARDASKLKKGTLKIGVTPAFLYSSALKAIWKFKETHPQIEVDIFTGAVDEQINRLRKSRVDIAILQAPAAPKDEFSVMVVDQEPLGVLVAYGHPLQKKKKLQLKDLNNETLIMHDRKEAEGFHRALIELLSQNKIKVHFRYRRENENCALLASTGQGLLLTTKSLSKFATTGTKLIPIENEKVKMSFAAYWPKETSSTALKTFLSFLENQDLIKSPKSACLMSLVNW